MVYSEVPNFSEPNPELLAQANQQNKSVSTLRKLASWCRPLKNTLVVLFSRRSVHFPK